MEGRNNAGFSRTPLHPACRTRTIWQCWPRPGFVRAAPTLPGTTRIRLPSAPPTCYDRPEAGVSHLHSNHNASRRKPNLCQNPAWSMASHTMSAPMWSATTWASTRRECPSRIAHEYMSPAPQVR